MNMAANIALVSKVVWSRDNQTLFYALPNAFAESDVLPNDYFSRPIHTKDTFWKLNTTTGKNERLIPLENLHEALDATDLFLSEDESTLFFTDRVSGKLYHLSL